MKNILTSLVFLLFYFGLSSQSYLHIATSSNINGNKTYFNIQTKPSDAIIVSHNWKTDGPYNNSSICVKRQNNKIEIINTNGSKIPDNAKYNVFVSKNSSKNYTHIVKNSNTTGHITFIENPKWLKKVDIKLLVTNAGAKVINNNPVGIYYTSGKWAIYNQNKAPMKEGTQFYIYECQECTLVTASNPSGNHYDLQVSKFLNNPNKLLFLTQYWTGVYNEHEVGVWYNKNRWSIFNQDRVSLPANSKFLVASKDASSLGIIAQPISVVAKTIPNKTATSTSKRTFPAKIKVSLSGISVDDHQENTWGSVEFCVQKNENGQWVDVMPIGKRTAWNKWSRSKSNPLMCYPYPKNEKLINNIQAAHNYDVDLYAVDRLEYRIKYKAKLTCNHKDNFAASDGDHAMRSIETDYITIYMGDAGWALQGKKFKTDSNREHTFIVQFYAEEN